MRRTPSQIPVREMSSVGAFLDETGSALAFTGDQMTEMFSAAEEAQEDFYITVNNRRYMIPHLALSAHFQVHARPEKAMTVEQENEFLRKQLMDLKKVIGKSKIQGEVRETEAEKMIPEYVKENEAEKESENIDKILASIPDDLEEVPDKPFKGQSVPRDTAIPTPSARISDKMSMEEIQMELKKSVKGKEPIKATSPAPRPASPRSNSPKASEEAL